MKIEILATRTCSHRAKLERLLQELGVDYGVIFVDERPELIEDYQIFHSPNLLKDGKIVFRAQPGASLPTLSELRAVLEISS